MKHTASFHLLCQVNLPLILYFLICRMELIIPASWMNYTKDLAHRDTTRPLCVPPSSLSPPFSPCPQQTPCQFPFFFSTGPSSSNSL